MKPIQEFLIELNTCKSINGGNLEVLDSEKKDYGDGDTMSSTKKDVDTTSGDTYWKDYQLLVSL